MRKQARAVWFNVRIRDGKHRLTRHDTRKKAERSASQLKGVVYRIRVRFFTDLGG